MTRLSANGNGALVGDEIRPSELGGEYLGWTGFPGWKNQAEYLGITHIRWPSGINAEDRIEPNGYAFDLSTPSLVDNWPLSSGAPRQGLAEMFAAANESGASFSMIVPSARYVETMLVDPLAATEWIHDDIDAFVTRLADGDFGQIPTDFTLEIGAEYYSTDAWAANASNPDIVEAFAQVFAELVSALNDAETVHGSKIYSIAVQAARFQSDDDGASVRDGERADADEFIAAFQEASLENAIDGLIWHRYVYTFGQTSHHLTPDSNEHTLENHLAHWEAALGHSLDLTIGWAAPDIDRDGASASDPFFDFGPRAAHPMLQMFSELSEAGMDHATLYGIDSPWTGALSTGSTSPTDFSVSFHGEVYGLMTTSLAGLTATDAFHLNSVFVDDQNGVIEHDHVNVFGFSDGVSRHVQFSAMWDLASGTVDLEVARPVEIDSSIAVLRVVSPTDSSFDALGQFRAVEAGLGIGGALVVQDMADFEVLQTAFSTNDTGIDFFQNFQTAVHLDTGRSAMSLGVEDELYLLDTTSEQQLVMALDGADSLVGSSGSDVLIGGAGADSINGGDGEDVLVGGDVSAEAISSWLSSYDFLFHESDFLA